MKQAICTLFEGNYHLGLAAFCNSLCVQNFRGDVYAGYRGELPPWAKKGSTGVIADWPESVTIELGGEIRLHFLPLETDYHFTNYKPDFMLELWKGVARDADFFYYIDPDIVVNGNWSHFEEWVDSGVILCEDVNSPLARNHPKRVGWRKYFGRLGVSLTFKEPFYANGGFIGLHRKNIEFIETWKKLQELMADEIGGLSKSSLTGPKIKKGSDSIFAPFSKTDQDALNATVEACDIPVSMGPKALMAFDAGRSLLPHALGQPKPWDLHALTKSLSGYPLRVIDKMYWKFANGVIKSQPTFKVLRKQFVIRLSVLISRFYRRI